MKQIDTNELVNIEDDHIFGSSADSEETQSISDLTNAAKEQFKNEEPAKQALAQKQDPKNEE